MQYACTELQNSICLFSLFFVDTFHSNNHNLTILGSVLLFIFSSLDMALSHKFKTKKIIDENCVYSDKEINKTNTKHHLK